MDETEAKKVDDCKKCVAGTYCPQGSVSMTDCDQGFYCEAEVANTTPCPKGTYGNRTSLISFRLSTYYI